MSDFWAGFIVAWCVINGLSNVACVYLIYRNWSKP